MHNRRYEQCALGDAAGREEFAMDGFLPLVEAFLAFALTILALTTAVSALVGTGQRLLRWRPRVLREMVDFFYRNEVQELIEDLGKAGTAENAGQIPKKELSILC